MTVYGDMLRAQLNEPDGCGEAVADLLAVVLAARSRFEAATHEDAATRLMAALAYDSAMLRLCRALDVPTAIGGSGPPDQARAEAELALSATLPGLSLTAP